MYGWLLCAKRLEKAGSAQGLVAISKAQDSSLVPNTDGGCESS